MREAEHHESALVLLTRLHKELAAHIEDASEKKDIKTAVEKLGDIETITNETEAVARYKALPAFFADAALMLLLSVPLYASLFIYLNRFLFTWPYRLSPIVALIIVAIFTYYCTRPLVIYLGRGAVGYGFAALSVILPTLLLASIGTIFDLRLQFAPTNTVEFLRHMSVLGLVGGLGCALGLWFKKGRLKTLFATASGKAVHVIRFIGNVLLPTYIVASAVVIRLTYSKLTFDTAPNPFVLPRLVPDMIIAQLIQMITRYQQGEMFIYVIWAIGFGIFAIGTLSATRVIRFITSKERAGLNFPSLSLTLALYAFSLFFIVPSDIARLTWDVPSRAITVDAEATQFGPFIGLFRLANFHGNQYSYSVQIDNNAAWITRADKKGVLLRDVMSIDSFTTTPYFGSRCQEDGLTIGCIDYDQPEFGSLPGNAICTPDASRDDSIIGYPHEIAFCTALTIDDVRIFTTPDSVIVTNIQQVNGAIYIIKMQTTFSSAEYIYLVDTTK